MRTMTMPKPLKGLPRKLNAQMVLDFKSYLAMGNDLENTCALVGVSKDSFKNWVADGQKRMDAEPDVSVAEWGERGIYTPQLCIASTQGVASA